MTIHKRSNNINDQITFNELSEILQKGDIKLRKFIIGKHSLLDSIQLKNTSLPKNVLVGPLVREDKVILPDGNTVLRNGDMLVLLGREEDIKLTEEQMKGVTFLARIKDFVLKLLFRNKEK